MKTRWICLVAMGLVLSVCCAFGQANGEAGLHSLQKGQKGRTLWISGGMTGVNPTGIGSDLAIQPFNSILILRYGQHWSHFSVFQDPDWVTKEAAVLFGPRLSKFLPKGLTVLPAIGLGGVKGYTRGHDLPERNTLLTAAFEHRHFKSLGLSYQMDLFGHLKVLGIGLKAAGNINSRSSFHYLLISTYLGKFPS